MHVVTLEGKVGVRNPKKSRSTGDLSGPTEIFCVFIRLHVLLMGISQV